MSLDTCHESGAFCVRQKLRGSEHVIDPGIMRVEGGFVGEEDVLIDAGLCRIAGGRIIGTGGGERAERLQVADVIGDGALSEGWFCNGDVSVLRAQIKSGQKTAADGSEGKAGAAGANYAGSGDMLASATGFGGGAPARSMRNSMSKPSWRTRSSK